MKSSDAVRALSSLRFVVGGSSWLTPRLAGRVAGIPSRASDPAPYFARLFAARDVALGVGAMQSSGDARRQWLLIGLACDVADIAAALAANRRGDVTGRGMVSALGGAVGATALGALALTGGDDTVAAA